MTKLTAPQIHELAEIISGAPVRRAPTKAQTADRFSKLARSQGYDPKLFLDMAFEDAKQTLITGKLPEDELPESDMLARAAETVGSGGPGLARLRGHADYDAITQKTQDEAAAVVRGEDPFAKTKKRKPAAPAKPAAAKPKAAATNRAKIQPDHMIDSVVENPKRPGTKAHTIFACYKNGQTVAQFVKAVEKAGYTEAQARADLSWDRRKGFIRISEASA